MSQNTVDNLRLSIIEKCKSEISFLEKKIDCIDTEIKIQKEYLAAYQIIIPTVENME